MSDSTSILLFMCFILCLGLVMYLYSLSESNKLFKFESKLFQWFKFKQNQLNCEEEKCVINDSQAHEILCELGKTLESPELTRFDKVKNEIHPKASEYYLRTQGMNVEVVPIPKRTELRLVK